MVALTPDTKSAAPPAPSPTASSAAPTASSAAPTAAPPAAYKGPSPLQELRCHPRSQPDSKAVSILFLTGDFEGQKLELGQWLGLVAASTTHEAGAQWETSQQNSIECASTFTRLDSRTFSLSVQFFDPKEDISHLVENLMHLRQISAKTSAPPLLLLRQGDLVAKPVFCEKISPKYDHPHAGNRGFRMATVNLTFKLQAGKNSENALGAPLTSTPLQDWKQKQTEADREKQALRTTVENLIAPCLGSEGSQQLQELLEQNKLSDPAAVAKLGPNAFVQSAIAGLISPNLLQKEPLLSKFKGDLALVVSQNEDGIGAVDGESPRQFAAALLSGDTKKLAPKLQKQAATATGDFQKIYANLLKGDLSDKSPLFDGTAGGRFRKLGSCGLTLRQSKASDAAVGPSASDQATIDGLKQFFGSDPTDKAVKERFGLETESQARTLKNGAPFTSKEQFLEVAGKLGGGVSAYGRWNKFSGSIAPATSSSTT